MSDDFASHRVAISDALSSIGRGVNELRTDLQRMTREVDQSSARLTTKMDELTVWKLEAERRLRALEENAAKGSVYTSIAAVLASAVISLVIGLAIRAGGAR